MTAERIKVFPAPKEIGYAADEARLATQGEDAFAADPEGLVLSRWWSLTVGDAEIPVFAAPVTRGGPQSFAIFEYADQPGAEPLTIVARSAKDLDSAVVRPLSSGLVPEIEGREVRIRVDGPCKLVLETNGGTLHPLFIVIHRPEENVPAADDPNTLYFGPGLHLIDKLALKDDQTLYIAGGAVVRVFVPESETPLVESDWAKQKVYEDAITSDQARNIAIRGRGILDMSMLPWHARKAIHVRNCLGVLIDGLTIVGAPHWTIHLTQSSDCAVRDIMLIGYRENSDGIDIVNSERVEVTDCLIRTGDDAVVVKAMADPPVVGGRDIAARRCIIWNDKVRCLGIAGETRTDIRDVRFEDCDIVHSFPTWTEEIGSLCIVVGDSGTIERVRFDDIRIEDERQYAMVCLILKDRWSVDLEAGRIRDVLFRNIHLPSGVPSLFHGFNPDCLVENVSVEGLYMDGQPVNGLEQAGFRLNEFVKEIRLR